MMDRPDIAVESADAEAAVQAFAAGLQAGHDQRDAEVLNFQFAADVIWGSPYGALGPKPMRNNESGFGGVAGYLPALSSVKPQSAKTVPATFDV